MIRPLINRTPDSIPESSDGWGETDDNPTISPTNVPEVILIQGSVRTCRCTDVDTATAKWVLYGEIVDSVFPDADERTIIDTFHAILNGETVATGTDERLIEAARTAARRYSPV